MLESTDESFWALDNNLCFHVTLNYKREINCPFFIDLKIMVENISI